MAEVVIQRCTLRLVRRHGWSWGPAPDRLLKAAVAALPLLIARRLGDLSADETDLEITERVNLTIAVKLSELLDLAFESAPPQHDKVGPRTGEAFEAKPGAAVTLALPHTTRDAPFEETHSTVATIGSEPDSVESPRILDDRVINVLRQWQRSGELEIHLNSFSQDELAAWFIALCAATARLAASQESLFALRLSEALQLLASRADPLAASHLSISTAHFHGLLEIVEQLSLDSIDEVELQKSLERLSLHGLGMEPKTTVSDIEKDPELHSHDFNLLPLTSPPARSIRVTEPAISERHFTQTEFNIRSALPFLLLGPLSQIGYLDALAATLETTTLTSEAPLFAAALAGKVLSSPQRGWRREPEDLAVAGVFAGLESAPPGDALAEFARKISGRLTPLDSLLTYTLVKGHNPASPLLLFQTREPDQRGLLLVELDGLFPVAWARDVQALMPALRYFREMHLLVQQASAEVETLQELDAAGFRFITDAPPTRAESWREIRLPSRERRYTNDRETKEAALARIARPLEEWSEETKLLWQALKVDRPAIPTARDSELELSLTMAAALALGTISWVLWRQRETATPLLALERFRDLPATVRFTSNAVQVRLPLGRRQQDLREHNFLPDLRNVPWLAGRRIEFL